MQDVLLLAAGTKITHGARDKPSSPPHGKKNLKAIYAVLNQTTDSERALHEVKRVFYLVQIGLLTPWKDFGKTRCPTHKSSKSGNKV